MTNTVPVTLPNSQMISIPWKEDTEDLAMLMEGDLCLRLGLHNTMQLPFFQQFTDLDVRIEP